MAKHKATNLISSVALQASGLPAGSDGAPDWINILPAGAMQTTDGRGPYAMVDVETVMAASLKRAGGRLVLDENHATDAKTPGQSAQAAGWMVALESREDGIWAQVEWTEFGRKLVEGRAYRGVSPVIMHNKSNQISLILRAALTNDPNLRGLAALHNQSENQMETIMDMSALITLLGLEEGATEEDVTAAITKLLEAKPETEDDAAMQSALTTIAGKLGVDVKPDTTAICSAIDGAVDTTKFVPISDFKALQSQVSTMSSTQSAGKAETVVDAAIKEGRVGVKPLRDHYISRHSQSAEGAKSVEKELAGLPMLTGSGMVGGISLQSNDPDKAGLSAADNAVCVQLGIDPKEYAKTLKANGQTQEAI